MINGPDGLTGAVMAVESIRGAAVLLHGPAGCRVRNSLLSMALVPRGDRSWGRYDEPYFAGYSRVPASYIDGDDLVGGAVQKLEDALDAVRRTGPELIVVVDCPGASLMGDNHTAAIRDLGVSDGVMVLEGETMSRPWREVYGRTLASVVRHLGPRRGPVEEGTVCLLGLTVLDADWGDALAEFGSYLSDMGLRFACAPGAGASVSEMEQSVNAEFFAVVCPESCAALTDLYSGMGCRVVVPGSGAPVGFEATRSWILDVAAATGRDPSAALNRLAARESRARDRMGGMRYGMMRIAGMTYSAACPGSVLGPLSSWLSGGLSMVPLSLSGEDARRLPDSDVVFCDGNTALRMASGRRCRAAVSTGGAVMGSDGFVSRTLFGAAGAENILDVLMRASRGRRR